MPHATTLAEVWRKVIFLAISSLTQHYAALRAGHVSQMTSASSPIQVQATTACLWGLRFVEAVPIRYGIMRSVEGSV